MLAREPRRDEQSRVYLEDGVEGEIKAEKRIEKHQLNLIATAFRYSVQMTHEIDALGSG